MSNNIFDKDKKDYDNVDIPEELDFVVRKTLKEAKNRKYKRGIYKPIIASVVTITIFIISVNTSPIVANAVNRIPGLSRLIQLVTFDKGFDNAVSEGLAQDINWNSEQNGVSLTVTTIVGDWKNLWVGYTISDNDKYEISMEVLDANGEDTIEYLSSMGFYPNQANENYTTIKFLEYTDEFILRYKIFKTRYEGTNTKTNIEDINDKMDQEYVAVFDVPINLDETIFNNTLRNVELTNTNLETSIGAIRFNKLETSKTRIGLSFTLESDKYDFMSFDNPRLVDEKGNVYEIPNVYTSGDDVESGHRIEFKGEIKDKVKTLEFKCDGIYYAPKGKKSITINLKNKIIESNIYGFRLESVSGNDIVIASDEVESVTFDNLLNENGEEILASMGVAQRSGEVQADFKLRYSNLEKIEIPIQWILKDKTDGVAIKLIQR